MFDYIAKIWRGTAIVDIIIIIGGIEVLFDSVCIIGYNTISDRDRIRYNMFHSSSGSSSGSSVVVVVVVVVVVIFVMSDLYNEEIMSPHVLVVVDGIKPSMKGWQNINGIKPSMKGWRNIIGIKPSMKVHLVTFLQ